jgi:hypothetical protein
MADPAAIASLRLLISEPTADTFTDAQLSTMIDEASGDLNRSAYDVWVIKASNAASLVDMSEGGSTRKMSDLQKQALTMASHFSSQVSGGVDPEAPRFTTLSKLARP